MDRAAFTPEVGAWGIRRFIDPEPMSCVKGIGDAAKVRAGRAIGLQTVHGSVGGVGVSAAFA